MKKPIINQFDRMLMRESPDTLFAQTRELMIARLKFQREMHTIIMNTWLYKKLAKYVK